MGLVIGIALVAALILLYVVTYLINEKTPVPEGCENLEETAACGTCTNHGCLIRKNLDQEIKHDQQ